MARLDEKTFPGGPEGAALLAKVKKALQVMTGMPPPKDGNWTRAPQGLDADRDVLKEDWRAIWMRCVIRYDPNERGASALHGKLTIGPFFLERRFTELDLRKVILHEYLHEAIDISWKEAHHGQIDQIIQFNLKWPGPPNPAEGLM